MIYVTGDCHGNFRRFQSDCFPEQANMTKDDTVIITGDCGGVWFGDSRDDETLDWLERLPFTLVYVCGNHENYDALATIPRSGVARRQGASRSTSCATPDARADLRAGGLPLLHHGRCQKP